MTMGEPADPAEYTRYLHWLTTEAGKLWDAGKDTCDIAKALAVHESRALYLVSLHRASPLRRRVA